MKTFICLLAFAISCAVAKPRTAEVNPSASLVESLEAEIKPLLSDEHGSTRHKYVCYWFGCIWVPDWFPSPPTTTEAPFECTSAGHFADRDDCGKYIVCQDAGDGFFIEHSMPCPSGLYFNPDTHHCDYPSNVPSCSNRNMPQTVEVNPSASLIEAIESEINPLLLNEHGSTRHKYVCYWFGCIWVPDWFPSPPTTTEAPFECTSAGHFADRDDCGKYIVCQDAGDGFFIEHSMPCPSGLYFNPDTHHCDYPSNVPSCSNRNVPQAVDISPSQSLVQALEAEVKPLLSNEHGSTRHKYVCYWFGCIWVPDWFPSPPTTTVAPFECTSAGHFADRDDCGKYIVCQDAGDDFFIEHSMSCPTGLYFNPDSHQCDYPSNVPSCSNKNVPQTADISPSQSLVQALEAEIKPLLSNEHGSTRHKYVCYWFGCIWVPDWFPSPKTTTEAPFECTSAGHFADRDDCTKYIVCQDAGDDFFIEHSMPCPSGLYFNPDTHHCDYPSNVPSCSNRL